MIMDVRTLTGFLALVSSILLTLTTVPVQGAVRCPKKWVIFHMCRGASGKRSMPDSSSHLTVAERMRAARQQALESAVRAGYEAPESLSLIARLQPEVTREISPRMSDNLLASELAAWIQDAALPSQKEVEPVLERRANVIDDDFSVNDVMGAEPEMIPDDMETVRDIRDVITALTLKRALRTAEGLRSENRDTRDQML